MSYRRLFLFLEGDDDQRFFEAVIIPRLENRYDSIRLVQVSEMEKEKVAEWLRSIEGMEADYLFVRDLDRFPCVSAAKEALQKVHPRLDPNRIQVVKVEIESWYCAGIGQGRLADSEMAACAETEWITKERLNAELPSRRPLRILALAEILESYDLERAARRNGSLRYFLEKHLGVRRMSLD